MRAREFIYEGGWGSTVTQGTVINPSTVKKALAVMQQFTKDFNTYLADKGLGPVEMGRPTGSSAYHDVDAEDKIYGDIDLQMIGPAVEGSYSKYNGYWNKLAHDFVLERRPGYVHPTESKIAHPIIEIGKDQYVQIDLMWHTPELSDWGAARVTPERGVKGLLYGKMFSVMGDLLGMSIQHAGVQLKVSNGQRVPFSKQKDVEILTIAKNPKTYILDTFLWLAQRQGIKNPQVAPELRQNAGTDIDDAKISRLVAGVKGFAASAEANGMWGKADLADFATAQDFLAQFINKYKQEAIEAINDPKRDKAETPEAKARAEADKQKIQQGLDMVLKQFAG